MIVQFDFTIYRSATYIMLGLNRSFFLTKLRKIGFFVVKGTYTLVSVLHNLQQVSMAADLQKRVRALGYSWRDLALQRFQDVLVGL